MDITLNEDQLAEIRRECCEISDCKGLRALQFDTWTCWIDCEAFKQQAEKMIEEKYWE